MRFGFCLDVRVWVCVCVNLRGFVGYTYSYVLLLLLVFSSPPAITTTMMILLIHSRRHARFHKYHEISGWREQMDFNYIFIICVYVCAMSRNSSGIDVCMSMYHIANDHTASLSFRDSKPKSMATTRATMYYANILFVCPWWACVCVYGVRVWESDAAFCGSK